MFSSPLPAHSAVKVSRCAEFLAGSPGFFVLPRPIWPKYDQYILHAPPSVGKNSVWSGEKENPHYPEPFPRANYDIMYTELQQEQARDGGRIVEHVARTHVADELTKKSVYFFCRAGAHARAHCMGGKDKKRLGGSKACSRYSPASARQQVKGENPQLTCSGSPQYP